MEETNQLLREILAELRKMNEKKEVSRAKRASVQGGRFLEFWDRYPRAKTGKLAAEKAYEKSITITTHDNIMSGVDRYARKLKREPVETSLIPHASTWLNAGRYDDEDENEKKAKNKIANAVRTQENLKSHDELDKKRLDMIEWTENKKKELGQEAVNTLKIEAYRNNKEKIDTIPSLGNQYLNMLIREKYDCPFCV